MPKPRWSPDAVDDLASLPTYARPRILDEVEEQLAIAPGAKSRRRKFIKGLIPPWSTEDGFWQLRVDPYRVFYDVEEGVAIIRAVRDKPHGMMTEEIL